MAKGDFNVYNTGSRRGSRTHQVQAGGTPPAINAGELVLKTLGTQYVIAMATNKPVVATDFIAGLSAGAPGSNGGSTELSATTDGVVDVFDLSSGDVILGNPKVAATWNTQAKYNALVGARVLIDVTSSKQTVLASDSSTSGCVIEDLNIAAYPAKVAFSLRLGTSYLT